jgi:hypothetical protein
MTILENDKNDEKAYKDKLNPNIAEKGGSGR